MPEKSGIFYTDRGKGFPILFIHGFCETHEIWNTFSKELSKDFRVLTIDLPGFGNSKLLNSSFSIAHVASNVCEWLKELQIKSCIAIGHSLGGYVTLEMAKQEPEVLKAFCLFHSTAWADTEERKRSRNKVIQFISKHGVQPFIESFIPPLFSDQSNLHILPLVRLASQTPSETLIAYTQAMRDRPDRTNVLQQFEDPILFITGERDTGISPESIINQLGLTTKGTLHLLPEVSHMGMLEEEAKTICQIREFVMTALP